MSILDYLENLLVKVFIFNYILMEVLIITLIHREGACWKTLPRIIDRKKHVLMSGERNRKSSELVVANLKVWLSFLSNYH